MYLLFAHAHRQLNKRQPWNGEGLLLLDGDMECIEPNIGQSEARLGKLRPIRGLGSHSPGHYLLASSLRSSHLQQSSDISEHFLGWARSRSQCQEDIKTSSWGPRWPGPWAAVVAKTPVTSDSCLLRRVINRVTEPWWADEKWTGNFGITDG